MPPVEWEIAAFVAGAGILVLLAAFAAWDLRDGGQGGGVLLRFLRGSIWSLPVFAVGLALRHRRISKQLQRNLYLAELRQGLQDSNG